MKAFIISRNRPEVKTRRLLPRAKILVDSQEQFDLYARHVPRRNLINLGPLGKPCCRPEHGKAHALNIIFSELTTPGEWCIIADDNLESIETVAPDYHHHEIQDFRRKPTAGRSWHQLYRYSCSPSEVLELSEEWRQKAETDGYKLVCAGEVRNYYFRAKRWRTLALAQAKFSVQQNWGFQYPLHDPVSKADDTLLTAEELYLFGGVLIDNYVYPVRSGFNQPGGHGTLIERWPHMAPAYERLEMMYPGLFRRKAPSNFAPPYYFLDVKIHTRSAIEKWRNRIKLLREDGSISSP